MRSLLIEVWKRLTPWNKLNDIYANDTDNAYPERMERLINNSITARSASTIMTQFLLGKGYGPDNDGVIINKSKNLTLLDFAGEAAEELVKQKGIFIHVNWNALYKITDFSIIPYDWCRIGKSDSTDYAGKIAICKDWTQPRKSGIQLIDVYNPRKKIIDVQVEKSEGWENYKGQVLFINTDSKLIYPLSRIDAVANDCDSEAQAAIYKNRLLRKGFFGNTLVVTRPLGTDNSNDNERDSFQQAIRDSLGADSTGGVLCLEMDFAGEKLDDAILIKQIESKIDDKLFNYTETSVRENILIAFNNLPAGLIKTSESSLFGNSGEAIREMKQMYWENTTRERNILTNVLNLLLQRSQDNSSIKVEPIKLIENATINNQE